MKKPASSGALSGNQRIIQLGLFTTHSICIGRWRKLSPNRMHCCDFHFWRWARALPQPDTWTNCHAQAIQRNLCAQKRKLQVRKTLTNYFPRVFANHSYWIGTTLRRIARTTLRWQSIRRLLTTLRFYRSGKTKCWVSSSLSIRIDDVMERYCLENFTKKNSLKMSLKLCCSLKLPSFKIFSPVFYFVWCQFYFCHCRFSSIHALFFLLTPVFW